MFKFSADDIANQAFEKSFRGFDVQQVEEFLNGLAREWNYVMDEFKRLQLEVESQAKDLRDYRRRERSLVEALEMAKQVADEIRHQAERDAELVIARTELKAEKILIQAERRLGNIRSDIFEMQQQRTRLEAELRGTLHGHMKMLELMSSGNTAVDYEIIPDPPVTKVNRAVEYPSEYDYDDECEHASVTLDGL